jgi:hypothetical protein
MTKVIYNTRDKLEEIIEGNHMISSFRGETSVNIAKNSTMWLCEKYHTSWDALMPVIKEIKKYVYNSGYKLFTIQHRMYTHICNNCYDSDLEGAWFATVKWISHIYYNNRLIYDSTHFNEEEPELMVSEHALDRFKERFYYDTDSKIENILCTDNLLKKVKENGDGRYLINGVPDCIAIINNFVITTVLLLRDTYR